MTQYSDDQRSSEKPQLEDLISLTDAAQISGFTTSHLRLLVSTGEVWGIKLGRNWFTTEEAINAYLKIEHRPGPKPKKTEVTPL
jgi:hypothetical protein